MIFSDYSVISKALQQVQSLLTTFGDNANNDDRLTEIFGDTFKLEEATALWSRLADGDLSWLPKIEIRSTLEINNANGAYSATTNTIYLSQEFVTQNTNNISEISSVLLEEIGHFLDWQFNIQDAPGDEGFLFASLVQGNNLTANEIAQIKTENDAATVVLNGQTVAIEQANFGDNPAFDLIGLTQLRNDPKFADIDGSGFSVAVIDSGLDAEHPLIEPNFTAFYDFTNDSDTPTDLDYHGTHVSGTIGAADESIGVATDVDLIGLKVFEPSFTGASYEDIETAIGWILDNQEKYNITAVNLSFGGGFYTPDSDLSGEILIDDISRLEQAGITVIAGAGNLYYDSQVPSLASPAIFSTLAVGAVWQEETASPVVWESSAQDNTTGKDRIVSFSQRLDEDNFIFAPGALIESTVPGGGTESYGGTSFASPHVAGAVALVQETAMEFGRRSLSPDEVADILISSADTVFDGDDEDDNVINTEINYPRLNIYSAVVQTADITGLKLTGGTAQIAYVAYYGRPADKGGLDYWNNALTNNQINYAPRYGSDLTENEEAVYDRLVNDFGTSAEANRLLDSKSNSEQVNQVYQFTFNRDAEESGLEYWTEQIDKGNITLASMALEVALGARGEDIVILNNKIASADMFSDSINSSVRESSYQGSSGEVFGRNWLEEFGVTASSQEQVDSAFTDLVNNNLSI